MFWGIASSLVAGAQDLDAEAPVEARIGLVLVSTFQPEGNEGADPPAADAARLEAAVATRIAQSHPLLPMSRVPSFETQEYGADVYMLGCPPGKYAGCALVVGQRASVDWVLGATLRREVDEFEDDEGPLLILEVHIVDVFNTNEVASFGVLVDPTREEDVVEGIGQVFDELLRNTYPGGDLRDTTDPEEVARARAQREAVANSLAALEARLGRPVRSEASGRVEPQRVTRDDLAEYDDRDDAPPWERLGLEQGEYVRFANSGMNVEEWRAAGRGRFSNILIRGSAGYGPGPWQERYESQVLLSDTNLSPVDQAQLLEVIRGGSLVGEVEVGFGVAPFLDLGFAAVARGTEISVSLDEQVQNRPPVRPPVTTTDTLTTWQFGARATFAPFPRWRARPTLGAGIGWWAGVGTPATERFEALDAPAALFVEGLPGVEVDLDGPLVFIVRGVYSQPLVSTFVVETREGKPLLTEPPASSGPPGPGWAVTGGVLLRIGPLVKSSPRHP